MLQEISSMKFPSRKDIFRQLLHPKTTLWLRSSQHDFGQRPAFRTPRKVTHPRMETCPKMESLKQLTQGSFLPQSQLISGTWFTKQHWLVVSTHLKDISQNGNLPQIGVNIKKRFETTTYRTSFVRLLDPFQVIFFWNRPFKSQGHI